MDVDVKDYLKEHLRQFYLRLPKEILIKNTAYSDLVYDINNSELIPNTLYRITDYVTTTSQTQTRSAGHQFDLIVFATSENTLDCRAVADLHEGDTYFSANGNKCDLSKWQVWYDIKNDTSKYAWAFAGGRGVIYRMIDEWGNDCPYDFKNIQFKRKLTDGVLDTVNGTDTWVYTFNAWNEDDSIIEDASLITNSVLIEDSSNNCRDNVIGAYQQRYDYIIPPMTLNDIVFLNTYTIENVSYFECYSNIFGNNCSNNTFGNSCYRNTFGNNCSNNTLGHGFYSNTCANNFYFNTFGHNCDSNIFGNSCSHNTFGDNCSNNIFENNCGHNTFGDSCSNNIFGNNCDQNTFGDSCSNNTFGNICSNNTLKNNCIYNEFGQYCRQNTLWQYSESNSFGESCYGNTLGNSSSSSSNKCYYNSFGNGCYSNNLSYGCYNNSFGNGCSSNVFGNSCYSNSFGNQCHNNSLGSGCSGNSFGNRAQSNTFGNGCSINIFGNLLFSNTFGNNCIQNTFGNRCQGNIFGNYCSENNIGSFCASIRFGNSSGNYGTYVRNVIVMNRCQYIRLYNSGTANSNNYLQNIYIAQGVQGTSSSYVEISTIERNLNYRTTVGRLTDGTIRIYKEDEGIDVIDIRRTT